MSRKYAIGDRVTIRTATTLFHTRTQAFMRGKTGTVVEYRPSWVIPEDEAWGRDSRDRGGREEPFYVVRFRQQDLWPGYTGHAIDSLQTEVSERWMLPAGTDEKE